MTARDHDAVFQALADPTRRTLLRTLSASGPSTLAELSSGVPMSRQAVSKHLALLQDAGLVVARGEVRGRRYELTPAPLADALGWMVDVGAGWDDRLARLKRQVEARPLQAEQLLRDEGLRQARVALEDHQYFFPHRQVPMVYSATIDSGV